MFRLSCSVPTGAYETNHNAERYRRKVEDWLARCRWLNTTKLDDGTRARLDRLIRTLEQDLEEDESSDYRNGDLALRCAP